MITPLKSFSLLGFSLFFSLSSYSPKIVPGGLLAPEERNKFLIHGKSDELLAQTIPFTLTGKVSVDVNTTIDAKLAGLLSGLTPNLTPIKSTSNDPRYVAIGGSITAGVRNAGLYRQAQLTSYPNLLALQMGLKNFKQPLFDISQGNGSGYVQLDRTNTSLKYMTVNNNLAILETDPLTFPAISSQVDNLGMPFMGLASAFESEEWRFNSSLMPALPYERDFRPYFRRLLLADNQQWTTTYIDYIKNQKADFWTIELGMDDAIWYATKGGYRLAGMLNQISMIEGNPILTLLTHMSQNNIKGMVATVPDVINFPYFKNYTLAKLNQLNGNKKLYAVDNDLYNLEPDHIEHIKEMADGTILLPTPAVTALFNNPTNTELAGYSIKNPLASQDVLSINEINNLQNISALNNLIKWGSKKYSVPIFDLYAVINKILTGNYISDDGLKIDPSFPDGNFFSNDGLYPSALGQAVITNEWIKAINAYYKTDIPLLNIRQISLLLN